MSTSELATLHRAAREALRGGDASSALGALLEAVRETAAREAEYQAMLVDLRGLLVKQRMVREAMSVDWYLGDSRAQSQLVDQVPPSDRARTLEFWAEREKAPDKATRRYLVAAEAWEAAEMPARAAICRERGKDFESARALWSRLSGALGGEGGARYAAALARFNLARTSFALGDKTAAQRAVVQSVHLLEEAADRYEQQGQRERAFDCFQVLTAIGKQSEAFEHVLEGSVNASRILREDNLRFYALQSLEDAIGAARDRGEYAAAATLAQELSQYAAAQGMQSLSAHGTSIGAQMWQAVARSATDRGLPAEIAENALLAAIVALARQGQFADVGRLYQELAGLDLPVARREAHARAAKRYRAAVNGPSDAAPLPAHLRQDTSYPDVWHVDLVEWEQHGRASDACGDVLLDSQGYSEPVRRRALGARLTALEVESARVAPVPARARLCERLGQLELYSILAPLEALFAAPEAEVRAAVLRSLERFMYKRTFVTVRAALADPDAAVRAQAHRTLEALRFPHAFDPLARVLREVPDPEARAAALRAVARIDTPEAAELLLGVLQHEGQQERAVVVQTLRRARGQSFVEAARRAWPTLGSQAQATVREVLGARGESV